MLRILQALRGTQDILPDNIYKWNHVESVIKELCALYGYSEIRTPRSSNVYISFATTSVVSPIPRRNKVPRPQTGKKAHKTLRCWEPASSVISFSNPCLLFWTQIFNLIIASHRQNFNTKCKPVLYLFAVRLQFSQLHGTVTVDSQSGGYHYAIFVCTQQLQRPVR